MSTPTDDLKEHLKDDEFRDYFGAAVLPSQIGILLTRCRVAQGLSPGEMAERIGVSEGYYRRIAAGDANPRVAEVGTWFARLDKRGALSLIELVRER